VLLTLALPGAVYIYQGEELGLPEVEDLPDDVLQDPMFFRSGGADPGRDGCRVPLPWAGDEPPFGFSDLAEAGSPWLPQPAAWRGYTAELQEQLSDSMLALYRHPARQAGSRRRSDLLARGAFGGARLHSRSSLRVRH
jgi:alpha-glucosidase